MAKRNASSDDAGTKGRRPAPTPKKGRPTPTRKEAEAARRNPVVGRDRKASRQQEKRQRNEKYQREQLALRTGDESNYPDRDRGRVRRIIRDTVDSRWSFAEFLLPVMVAFLLGMLLISWFFPSLGRGNPIIVTFTIVLYGFFALSILEAMYTWRSIKKEIHADYPKETIPRGSWFYCYARMIMIRRWRSPRPQVPRKREERTGNQTPR